MLFGGNRSISVLLSVNPAGVRAGLAVAKREMSDFAKAGVDASQKHQRAWNGVADGLGKAGLAVGAFAAVSVVSFARFDKSLSRAAAATRATASELTSLRAAALKAGADTQYSATEAADAITEMAKAGVSVQDILGGGLTGTLALAAAGELEVARAAEIASTTLTQFGLSGRDVGHVADVLAAGAGKAQGSVEDLAQGLKYVGPVSASMGVSLEQTTGVLAEFASQGIIGEQAGTSLRGMLLSLTAPSAKAAETMEDLGINLYDAQGRFIGLDGVAAELQDSLSGMSEAQRSAALGTIFGNEQMTAATVLYRGGAQAVQEWTSKVNDSGFAADQAAKLMDNLAGDVEELKGSLETALISSGSGANEGLRSLTQTATDAVNAFNGLPAPIQEGTVKVAALTAGLLLVSAAALKTVGGIASAKRNIQELGASSATASGLLRGLGTALGVVTVAVPLAAEAFDQLNAATTRGAPGVNETTAALLDFAKTGRGAGAAADVLGADFAGVVSTAKSLSGVTGGLTKLGDQAGKVVLPLRALGKPLEEQRAALESVDQALAGLVAGGKSEQAAAAFARLGEEASKQGLSVDDLRQQLPAYREALAGVEAESKAAAGATGEYRHGVESLAAATEKAAVATENLIASTETYTSKALEARGGARGYEAALDAATAAAKENGKTLDITGEKGRANADSLDAIATAGLKYAEATYQQTGSTEKFRSILERTREDLIKAGRRFGLTRGEARRYADQVLRVPSKAETDVIVRGLAEANEALRNFVTRLAIVNGKVVRVRVEANAANVREGRTANLGSPSAARATGGILPGPPSRRDNMVIAAASGEFVVNAAQTARHRPLLEAINSGRLPGFAEGGFVDVSPFSVNDAFERYQSRLPKPITPQQVASALRAATQAEDRRKNAALALRNAERDLYVIRHKHPKNIQGIKDAEDRLDRVRRSYASARANETAKERAAADAIRRRNAPRGFDLGQFGASLLTTVKQTEAYRRQLSAIEKRGGVSGKRLADYLAGMGAEGAPLVAALVKADAKTFTRILQLLRRLDPEAFAKQTGESVTRFANGGIQPHYATGLRLYGEPETGGEAYIPLAASKRTRSKMLAEDVVARMGGAVAWSSHRVQPAGSSVSAAPSQQGRGGPLVAVENLHLVRGTPEQVGSELMFAVRTRGG
jgi:TP901 family phage tail tape measure protein